MFSDNSAPAASPLTDTNPRTNHAEDMLLDFDGWLGRQEGDIRHGIEAHLKVVPEAGRTLEKQRLASMFAVSEGTGIDLGTVSERWDVMRGGFAEKQGGDWLAVKDDEAGFNGRMVQRATQQRDERYLIEGRDGDDEDAKTLQENSLVAHAERAAIEGKGSLDALAAWQAVAGKQAGYLPANAGRYQQTATEAHARLKPLVDAARPAAATALAELVKEFKGEGGNIDAAADAILSIPPEARGLAIRFIKEHGEKEAANKGFWEATGTGLGRGFAAMVRKSGVSAYRGALLQRRGSFTEGTQVRTSDAVSEVTDKMAALAVSRSGMSGAVPAFYTQATHALTAEEAKKWNARIDLELNRLEIKTQLVNLGETTVDPVQGGSWVRRKLWMPVVESAATMAVLAVPFTWAPAIEMTAQAYRDDEYQRLRGIGMDPGQAHNIAGVTGLAQAGLDKVQLRSLAGKLPGVSKALNRFALSGGTAARFGKNFAGQLAVQTSIELLQDHVVPALVQDVLASDPKFDPKWADIWHDVASQAGDTALGMILLSGAGAAGQTRSDGAVIKGLSESRAAMRMSGFSMKQIEEIQAAPMEERGALLAKYVPGKAPEGQEREAMIKEAVSLAKEDTQAAAVRTDAMANSLRSAGVTVERTTRDGVPLFRVKQGETVTEHATPEEAMLAASEHLDAEFKAQEVTAEFRDMHDAPGVRDVVRNEAGWHVIDDAGRTHTVASGEAVPALFQTIGRARNREEADAMIAEAEMIAAQDKAEGVGSVQTFRGEERRFQKTEAGGVEVMASLRGVSTVLDFDENTLTNLHAQMKAAGLDEGIIRGSNYTLADDTGRLIRHYETNAGADVSTILHERFETLYKAGKLSAVELFTAANELAALPAFDPASIKDKGQKRVAESLRRIALDDAGVSDAERRETFMELAVADRLGQFKDGTAITPGSIQAGVREAAMTATGPKRRALESFRRMLAVVRRYLGSMFGLAKAIREARESGAIKKGEAWDNLMDRLLGIDGQKRHDEAVVQFAGPSFSLGSLREDALEPSFSGRIFTDASETKDSSEAQAGPQSSVGGLSDAGGNVRRGNQKQDAASGPRRGLSDLRKQAAARLDMAQHNRRVAGDWVAAQREAMLAPVKGTQLDGAVARWAEDIVEEIEHALRDGRATKQMLTDIRPGVDYRESMAPFNLPVNDPQRAGDAGEWPKHPAQALAEKVGDRMEKILAPLVEDLGFTVRSETHENPAITVSTEDSAITFSLGSVNALESIANRLEELNGGAKAKLEAYADMARTLSGMARAARQNEETERVLAVGDIERQRIQRRANLAEKYSREAEDDIYSRHSDILSNASLAQIFENPLMDYLFRAKEAGKPFRRSRILSRAAATRRGLDVGGDYDAAGELPQWLFASDGLTPDKIVKELVETGQFGLSEDATPDVLWSQIEQALADAEKYSKAIRKVEGELISAREDARLRASTEAGEWAANERTKLAASDKRDGKRALVALDAMLMHLPAEVRGRVGGFARMAELTTNAAREKYFRDRLEKIDTAMEEYLRKDYIRAIRETIIKGRARRIAGQKDIGKLGVNAHTWLDTAEAVMGMSTLALEQRQAWVTERLDGKEELTPAAIADLTRAWDLGTGEDAARLALEQENGILELFGGLTHMEDRRYTADSGQLEAALEAVRETVLTGRQTRDRILIERRDRRAGRRAGLQLDSGNDGGQKAIEDRKEKARGFGERVTGFFRRGASFEQFVGDIFGRESDTHRFAEDTVLKARLTAEGLWQKAQKDFTGFIATLWPRTGRAGLMKHLESLSAPRAVPGLSAGDPKLSQMQALHFTMLWSDPDSRAWLRKHSLGDGEPENPGSERGPDVQSALEAFLTPEAKAIRAWLQERYDAQYDVLNDVFRRIHGVNMPRVRNYAPRMVMHGKDAAAIDPLNPGGMSARGVFAGFTKRRRPDLSAAPVAVDALQAFMQNQRVVSHFVGWAEASSDLRAVFSTSQTAPFIQAAAGKDGAGLLNQWLTDLEQAGAREAVALAFYDRFMRALADNALMGKLSVLAKQFSASYAAAVEIGWSDYARSARRLASGKAAITLQEAAALPIMRQRAHNRSGLIGQAASGTGATPWERRFRALGIPTAGVDVALETVRNSIGATDAMFTLRGAAIAYDAHWLDGKAQGLSDAAAHDYAKQEATRTIARTAQPDNVADKSLFENHASKAGRILFAFQSMNRQMLFSTAAAFRDSGIASGKAWRLAVTHWMLTGIVTQTIGAAMRDMFSDDDEVDDWKLADYGRSMLLGPLTGALYLGPIVDVAGSLLGGFERRTAPSPAAAMSEMTKELVEAVREGGVDGKDAEKLARAAGMAGQTVSGGWWSTINILANMTKQAVGFADNLHTTDTEATEADAERQREKEKQDRKAREGALSDEERGALKRERERGKLEGLERDAAEWRSAQ